MKRAATVFLLLFALAVGSLAVGYRRASGSVAVKQSPSQDRKLGRDKADLNEKRTALVIGNKNYKVAGLRNPINDAKAMTAALRDPAVGFEVEEKFDATLVEMKRAIRDFGTKLRASGGVGLFYYAGHGVQVSGKNFLVPLGAEQEIHKESDVEIFCLDADAILRQMEDAGARVNIVILDACRDNPFARSFRRSGAGGLAEMAAPSGSFIAYATDPGKTASDGEADNGLFTSALLAKLKEPGLRIEDVFNLAGAEVERKSGGRQQPWISSKLRGSFYFRPPVAVSDPPPTVTREKRRGTLTVTVDRAGVEILLDGKSQGVAESKGEKFRIEGLPAGRTVTVSGRMQGRKPQVKKVEIEADREIRVEIAFEPAKPFTNQVGMVFVPIAAGEFRMGEIEEVGQSFEKPVHRVVISERFWMGKFEVTRTQWASVMGSGPAGPTDCPDCPVTEVSWNDCQEFIARLNAMGDGRAYDLPTEAEWEYACRAGTQDGWLGEALGPFAWYTATEIEIGTTRFHSVGLKQANPWGLHDVYGNVCEWVADRFGENYYAKSPLTDPKGPETGEARVLRGGSFRHNAFGCRAAMRFWLEPTRREPDVGLRVLARPVSK